MEDELNKEILWVLKEIKKTQLLCKTRDFPEGFSILCEDNILFKEKPDGPDGKRQWQIIEKLVDDGVIETRPILYRGGNSIKYLGENTDKTGGIDVKLIEPKFSMLIKGLDNKNKKEIKVPKKIILYLDGSGDFWREPKNKYCYPIERNSDRYSIVKYLAENEGYQKTEDIAAIINEKIKRGVSGDIIKIRQKISSLICIPGKNVIEGKRGDGYRINPEYKIKISP